MIPVAGQYGNDSKALLPYADGMDRLRALGFVVAVAEERHFSRAAARLDVAQPTLSRTVRAVEAEHGVVLFDRTSRAVALTPAGEAFVAQARIALDAAGRAGEAARRAAQGRGGRVRIGFVVGAANAILPAVARELRLRSPELELDAIHLSVVDQLEALRAGRLDVALVRQPADLSAGLRTGAVLADRLVAAVPDTDPPAPPGDPWHAVRSRPFVFWPRAMAPSVYDTVMQCCQEAGGFTPQVVVESTDLLARLALVAAGLGVSLVTAGTRSALTRDGVRFHDLPGAPEAPIVVVHRPRPSPAALAVIQACRRSFDAAGDGVPHPGAGGP